MLTSEKARFWSGGISRSMSEGNLFDMEAQKSSRNCDITGTGIYNYWNYFYPSWLIIGGLLLKSVTNN